MCTFYFVEVAGSVVKSKWKSSFNSNQKSKCKSMIDLKFDVQKIRFDKQKYQISTRADRSKCELKFDFSGAANRVRTSNIAIAHQSAATCPGGSTHLSNHHRFDSIWPPRGACLRQRERAFTRIIPADFICSGGNWLRIQKQRCLSVWLTVSSHEVSRENSFAKLEAAQSIPAAEECQ